ncbi:cytochrome P450 2J4-like isoform X2 [Engystomops pustulosus]|uniref:cytochrome P450 2J4-like isoform X2 n=1 Tax=Engystomops pustulosus TaxID=76066 RepID=UPI003AFAF6B7
MMDLSTSLLLGLVILAFLWRKVLRSNDFPPGPVPVPVFGNLLQMDFTNPLTGLRKFSDVYGPVYSIYLGFIPAVVVRGFKDLREVLVTKGVEFADRPQSRIADAISGKKGLVAAPYGRGWKEHRRFTLSTLRNFGLGKKSMEQRIYEESGYIVEEFKKNKEPLYDPHFVLENAVSNIICSIVFGRRYDCDDSTFRDVLTLVRENMNMATQFWAQLYNAFGFLEHLPLPHRKIFRNVKTVNSFLHEVLMEHRRTRVPGEPRDYIDCYLDEINTAHEKSYQSTFDDENLFTCVADLFVAGTETTSASLDWCLLYLMLYPDIQEKCREEIDKIRGTRDHIDYDDRVNMPYTQAFLQEVQRFASVVPLGVAHSPINDVKLNGYTIPKGTAIITDLSSLNNDESQWKFPHEFRPENFLTEDGEFKKVDSFLPFSAVDEPWSQDTSSGPNSQDTP